MNKFAKCLVAAISAVGALSALLTVPANALPSTWWDTAYAARMSLKIQTSDALPDGYQVSFTINHAALVANGQAKADGSDFRILHWNGTTWDQELSRVTAVGSAWNRTDTKIYFKTTDPITASSIDENYFAYYGNVSATGAPANPNEVYDLFDDFESGPLDLGKWNPIIGNGSVSVVNGEAIVTGTSVADASNHLRSQATFNNASGLMVETSLRVPTNNTVRSWGMSLGLGDGTQSGLYYESYDTYGYFGYYNASTSAWTAMVGDSQMSDHTFTKRRYGQSLTASGIPRGYINGNQVALGGVPARPYNASLLFSLDPYTLGVTYTAAFDDIVVRKFVATEPTVTMFLTGGASVAVGVDASFSFTVAGRGTACNGETLNGSATGSVVDLGRVNVATKAAAAQDLQVSSNSAGGFVVYQRGTALNGPTTLDATSGTNAAPAPFDSGEAFGYTINDADLPGFVTDSDSDGAVDDPLWAGVTSLPEPVMSGSAVSLGTSNCVAYQVGVAADTPAGTYSATVYYTAVPRF